MKKFLPLIFILIFSSCSKEVSYENLSERNGVVYEINSSQPFTGVSVRYFRDSLLIDDLEDKKIHRKITYKDGIIKLYESFFENGQVEEINNYEDGMMSGLQIKYFKNGQLEETGEKIVGVWTVREEYYKNGQLKDRTEYKPLYSDGELVQFIRDGLHTRHYSDGQLECSNNYKEGVTLGPWECYHENGQLSYRVNYVEGEEVEEPYEDFYSNGQVQNKFNIDKDGNGTKERYFESGGLEWKFNVRNNKKHGTEEQFYLNGQPMFKLNYKDGEKDGEIKYYVLTQGGVNLKHKTYYKNDERNGLHEEYFGNGVIKETGNYTNNERTGIWKTRFDGTKTHFYIRKDCGKLEDKIEGKDPWFRKTYRTYSFLDSDSGKDREGLSNSKYKPDTYKIQCVDPDVKWSRWISY